MTKPKSGRKIPQFDLSHHRPRPAGRLMLGTRTTVAVATARHENVVRRHCAAVACDVVTRALLYDLEACERQLARVPRRVALSDCA